MPTVALPTLHPSQVAAFNLPGRFKVLRAGRRWGKALALDTLLPTPSGWATIGEVKEGDLLYDERGLPCRVIGATDVMHGRPCNEVLFSDGTKIVADDEHKWLTWDKVSRKYAGRPTGKKYTPQVRTTSDIRETAIYKGKESNHSIPSTMPLFNLNGKFIIAPYVLGAWLGDGSTFSSKFTCNDIEIIDELRKEGELVDKTNFKFMWIIGRTFKHKHGAVSFQSRLKLLGLCGNKHIPDAYMRASEKQRLALLQGLMDTDGCVEKNGRCEFVSTLPALAESVLDLVRSLGINARLISKPCRLNGVDCKDAHRVRFTTTQKVFRLPRKVERLKRARRDRATHHFIVGVQQIASVPVRCLAVDSPSHLFLVSKSLIPTHNTDFFKTLACDAATKGRNVGWFTPDYKIQSEAYDEILDVLEPIKRTASKMQGRIKTTTAGRIDFWTLENERAGRSRKYHLVIIDEAAFTKPNMMAIWERSIAPTLLDFKGRAFAGSTPNGIDGENFFYNICTDQKKYGFREFHAPTSTNPYMPADELERLRLKNHPLVYKQEFLAEFVDWTGVQFFDLGKMLVNGVAPPMPSRCDAVFATIDTAVKAGKEHDGTAVTYWAIDKFTGFPLMVLDWDIVQLEGSLLETWLPTVFQNLKHLAELCGARMGSLGAYIEDKQTGTILIQQALRRGWPAHAIDSKLTAVGKDERAISVSGYHYQGKVKLSAPAFEKMVTFKDQTRNHFMTQVLGFRIGAKDGQADDLLDTYTYGIAIALGGPEGY